MTQQHPVPRASVKKGYAAIISIIVILAVIVTVGLAVTTLSIGNAQMSLGQSKGEGNLSIVESCIEDALLTYNNTSLVPVSVTLPPGSCTITIDSSTPTSSTFTTSSTSSNYSRSIQVTADRTTNINIVNWIQTN
jgi:hypothetical protein